MRKRNLMIGAVVGLVGVVAAAGIASATITGHTYTNVAQKTKQSKKTFGPLGTLNVDVATTYGTFGPRATQTVLTIDKDWKFTPGKLAQCNAAALAGKDAAGAKAACPGSQVGQGSAVLKTAGGSTLNAIVTAFNGVRSGSNPTILLHVDVQGSTNKPILTGTIAGKVVTVLVPLVPGVEITDFKVTINQIVTGKKNGVKTFYLAARCSHKKWSSTETTTYEDGSTQHGAVTQKCKQKK
jgi:hypothetical protein